MKDIVQTLCLIKYIEKTLILTIFLVYCQNTEKLINNRFHNKITWGFV